MKVLLVNNGTRIEGVAVVDDDVAESEAKAISNTATGVVKPKVQILDPLSVGDLVDRVDHEYGDAT